MPRSSKEAPDAGDAANPGHQTSEQFGEVHPELESRGAVDDEARTGACSADDADLEGDGNDGSLSDDSDVDYGPVPQDMPRSQRDAWKTIKNNNKRFTGRFSENRWQQHYSNNRAKGGRIKPPGLSEFGPQIVTVVLPVHEGANPRYHVAGCEKFTTEGQELVLEAVEGVSYAMMLARELSQVNTAMQHA